MTLKIKQIVIFITISILFSCRDRDLRLSEIQGTQIPIANTLKATDSIEQFIEPYRTHVNKELDAPLSYAPYDITKSDGRYNSSAGNLMADIVYERANPIFKSRTEREIDFVVLNHGGIRSIISEGPVTARTAYEVMPFENTIVVLEMQGRAVRDLVSHLIRAGRPHPISGIQIAIDQKGTLVSVNIQGRPYDESRTYYVATSSYLATGGDDMGFFRQGQNGIDLQYKIRNSMIDYFKVKDTLKPVVDNRFVKLD